MSAFTTDAAAALPGPDWLRARRAAAAERFAAASLPSEEEEIWRYSRISALDLDRYQPVDAEREQPADVPAGLQPVLDAVGERSGLVVTRNGAMVTCEVDDAISRVPVEHDFERLGEGDVFTELNRAFARDPVWIDVGSGQVVPHPVVVLHWVDESDAAVLPRTVVSVGEGSELTVLEVVASPDVEALVAPVADLRVADAAHLRYLGAQNVGRRVWHIAYQHSRLGRDASLLSANAVLGADYGRLRADSNLEGQGGTSNLLAVYFGDQQQMHDFRTLQHHVAPKTTSDLVFKGAVEDQAQSVYSGLIRIRKGAAGTNAFQTNRNLVLSAGAHADSVPNLEIEENDVRCSHASAVGPIDEDQRYYLESRGVPTEVAERLIVLGFFDEVVDRAPVPGLRELLRGAVTAKLGATA